MHMQLHALNGIAETIAALKIEAAGYRTQARAISDTVPLLRQTLKQREYQLRQVLQDGESSSSQIRGARSAVSRASLAVDQAIAKAMLLEQRAATIEGSIISLSLQARTQAAAAPAPVAVPVSAPVAIAVPAPVAAPVPVPVPLVESAPVVVTAPAPAPVTLSPVMTRAGVSTFVPSPQPSPRMQPFTPAAASAGPDEITTPPEGKNILPLALAAGAVLLLLIKPKRKRRNA